MLKSSNGEGPVAMEPVAKRIRKIAGLGGVTDTALLRIFAALRDDRAIVDEVMSRSPPFL